MEITIDGVSGDPITPALIQGRSLSVRWLRNRESRSDGVTEYWSVGCRHRYISQ